MLHFSKADFKRSLNTRKPFKNKLKTFLKERETERDRDRERERQRETETERDRQRERQKKLPKEPKEEATEMHRRSYWNGCEIFAQQKNVFLIVLENNRTLLQ